MNYLRVALVAVQILCVSAAFKREGSLPDASALKRKRNRVGLTDEENHSLSLPKKMRCDGCRVATYHM